MKNVIILFVICISISACVGFERESNTTNYYEYNMSLEQACILKNHYQEANETTPAAVQAVIEENESSCVNE